MKKEKTVGTAGAETTFLGDGLGYTRSKKGDVVMFTIDGLLTQLPLPRRGRRRRRKKSLLTILASTNLLLTNNAAYGGIQLAVSQILPGNL